MSKTVALINPRLALARETLAPADWILANKLEPPQLHVDAVPRAGLLDRLDAGLTLPLTLLLAPPGFGKTTLLAQWQQRLREHDRANVAWLSMDEDDSEPGRFLSYLALAVTAACAEPGNALGGAPHWRELDVATTLGTLLRVVRTAAKPLVLILDDYDRVRSQGVDDIVTRLVEHGGAQLHVLVATRRAPSLPLARLSVRGCLQRLGARELALSDAETRQLLGPDLPLEDAHLLREQTEGWPVALQLAALWIAGDERRRADVARFSGRSVGLAAYLAEQVVSDLEPELRAFLLETSCLERFNPALADAVRQRHDSGQLLAQLHHFQGLLVPLDSEHEWFRYHPLFADYLHLQLEREQPQHTGLLHVRAAHWYAGQGQLLDAVRHAVRAQDVPLAAHYIAQAGSWQMLLNHGVGGVRTLLRQFDARTIRDTPALNLTQAYLHMKLGEFSHAQVLLERFRDFPPELRTPLERDYTVVVALLRDLLDQVCTNPHGLPQIAAQAAALDEDDHVGRGTLLCICATTALGRCDFSTAERHARNAETAMLQAGSEIGAAYALLHLAQSHFYRGQLDRAEQVYRRALAVSSVHQGADPSLHAACEVLLAQVQCERGRYDEAADLLQTSLEILEQHDGWLDTFAAAYSTALALARQRDRSGRTSFALIEHIETIAAKRRLARLSDLTVAWQLDVLLDLPGNAASDAAIGRAGGEAAFAHALVNGHGWRQAAALGFALARWHATAGRSGQALALLHQIETLAERQQDQYHLMRARARVAVVQHQRGDLDAAVKALRDVLDHTAGQHAWQVVLEIGLPAKALLRAVRQHDPEAATGTTRALTIQALLDKLSDESLATQLFSERELEVLAQLAQGHSNKQIARVLSLSENTVKFHLKNLYRKLEAGTREAALAAALQRGLITARGAN